jgi:hypothetical protein
LKLAQQNRVQPNQLPEPSQGQRVILSEEQATAMEPVQNNGIDTGSIFLVLAALVFLGAAVYAGMKLLAKPNPSERIK